MTKYNNPYTSVEAIQKAIDKAGSVRKLSKSLGLNATSDTVYRWIAELSGLEPKTPLTVDHVFSRLTDDTITEGVSLWGPQEFARILSVGEKNLRHEMAVRKIITPAKTTTPRMDSLKRRNRDLEWGRAALGEFMGSLRTTAADVKIDTPNVILGPPHDPRYHTPVEVVLHVSDIQFGEVVHPEAVPGGNYSPEVAFQRLDRWTNAVAGILESVSAVSPISRLWIAQGGDFVEGDNVFKGQQWHLAMDAGQQVATLAPRWAATVDTIGRVAKRLNPECFVSVLSVVGNHGVPGGRSAGAVPASLNFDFLTYEMARYCLPQGGVDWVDGFPVGDLSTRLPNKALYFEVAGHTFLLTHGDQDRGGGLVGVAVVSGQKNDLAVRVQTGVNHDYHLKGHYHKPTTISSGGIGGTYWNGTFVGANNLSVGRGGGSEPMQRVYVVHPEFGISMEFPIRLERPGKIKADVISL